MAVNNFYSNAISKRQSSPVDGRYPINQKRPQGKDAPVAAEGSTKMNYTPATGARIRRKTA
jgi:hypothetical protein